MEPHGRAEYRWNPTGPSLVTGRDEERNIETWGLKFTEGQSYRWNPTDPSLVTGRDERRT